MQFGPIKKKNKLYIHIDLCYLIQGQLSNYFDHLYVCKVHNAKNHTIKINESITRNCNSCDKTDYLIDDSNLLLTAGNKKNTINFFTDEIEQIEPFDLIRIYRLKYSVSKFNYHLIYFVKPLLIDVLPNIVS